MEAVAVYLDPVDHDGRLTIIRAEGMAVVTCACGHSWLEVSS